MFIRGITWCLCFSAVILGLYITLLVIVQPYTVSIYNKTEVALLMTLVFADFASYLFLITYNWYIHNLCMCATVVSGHLVSYSHQTHHYSSYMVSKTLTRNWSTPVTHRMTLMYRCTAILPKFVYQLLFRNLKKVNIHVYYNLSCINF